MAVNQCPVNYAFFNFFNRWDFNQVFYLNPLVGLAADKFFYLFVYLVFKENSNRIEFQRRYERLEKLGKKYPGVFSRKILTIMREKLNFGVSQSGRFVMTSIKEIQEFCNWKFTLFDYSATQF